MAGAITNQRTGKEVCSRSRVLLDAVSQGFGLMFRRRLHDEGWVFSFSSERIVSIHMLFVFFSIDCVWLDKRRKVVDIIKGVRPFSPYVRPKVKSMHLIELPAGTVEKAGIREDDLLSW
ncbi:MAG: DUF192 domain-containing protein [archaeon]